MTVHPSRLSLRAVTGDLQGQVFRIDHELVVGRSTSCHVFVPDRRISREHSRFYLDNDRLFVEDLKSHNGTYVNGQRVSRAELFHGDLIRLGTSQFSVESQKAEDSQAVRFVSDLSTVQPRLVKSVEPVSAPVDLGSFVAEEYFTSIGVGDTERFASTDKVESLLRKTRNFAILTEISKTLQRYSDLRESLPGLMDLVLQVVKGDRAALMLLDEDGNLIPKTVRYRDKSVVQEEGHEITLSRTVADWVLKERCAVITADASTDARFSLAESVVLNNLRSLLVVPVQVRSRILGLIEVENSRSVNGFDESDLDLVSVVAAMLGVALDHLEMSQARERAISQLQAAQEQLLATQERLVVSERMGLLGRLASGIAHEVKNHLSPLMLADLIRRKYPNDQEIRESAELMLEAQQRILALVDEIRSFASGSHAAVNVELHDLCAVIEGVVRFVRCDRAIKAADIHLQAESRPLVKMDAQRIRQVLINLIRNAADALPPKGGRIDIRVVEQDGQVQIEVQDNGRGIPEELGARIFEPFFTTKGDKGLGLGLDISRQIATAHGGSLTYESDAERGTTFRMTLPLTGWPAASGTESNPPDHPPFDDMKTDPSARFVPLGDS